jgi:N-hydroxyarylamine O-acetyltransferase
MMKKINRADTMDMKLYFDRIKYRGSIDATFEVLSNLQLMHLMNVPFENLDIQNHIKIDLDNLFNKIVIRKRGGFCYELNGLFYKLLKEIGFTVKMVSARVYNTNAKNYSPEFDHMALIVSIKDDQYLVDVGFGEFALGPIKMEPDRETNDITGIFRIELFDDNYKAVEKKNIEGKFIPEYIFSEKERQTEEFYQRCYYHQTSKESHFTQKKICSLPTQNGRTTLTGNTLKITEKGIVTEKNLDNEQEVRQVLSVYFGIRMQ